MSSTPGSERPEPTAQQRRNARVALICGVVFAAMVGGAYASVPLYRAFCQVTGFDGVVRKAQAAPDKVLAKTLEIRFDANVRDLPWDFTALQTSQTIRIGETGLAFFRVTNHASTPVTGHAVYNVVPEQAGAYFQKLQCFCFSDQTIGAGRTVEFPVLYFVDPKYADDFETRGSRQVTLSYTFYPAQGGPGGGKRAEAVPAKPVSGLGGSPHAGL
ncbi:cytochrome c oxidase assembly protein [Phenylobacterium sp.]|jgi:cytochrome c oxidase assembly protein subunit 11|uniref:cytochrome c oxidase assembly protein n=1 Tax=Phenylobacterium sp. TaxID=1871053 RepID=UPI002F3F0422